MRTPRVVFGTGDGPDVFAERYQKSATALVAVERALRRHAILDGTSAEFFDLYRRVTELAAEIFTSLWTAEPSAYLWVRRAFDLVGACVRGESAAPWLREYLEALGTDDPRQALVRHLDDFKGLALALHHAARRDCRLDTPWSVALPWAIPGSTLSLEGTGTIRIAGIVDGALEIADGARPRLRVSPVVRHAGCEVRLQPHAFNLPGLRDGAPVLAAGVEFQEEHRDLVAEALVLVERYHPETFADMRGFLRVIALKPLRTGGYTNLTHSDLPGAFIAGLFRNPYELADTFIHEMHHGRLFALEDVGPLFDLATKDALDDERYYSPWRDDLRPLRGLLHGLYVYVPVCVYWQRLHASGTLVGDHAAYALDRILRSALQLDLGIRELQTHTAWTPRGRALFDVLTRRVAAIASGIAAAGLPEDAPALACDETGAIRPERSTLDGRALTVRAAVEEHARRAHTRQVATPPRVRSPAAPAAAASP